MKNEFDSNFYQAGSFLAVVKKRGASFSRLVSSVMFDAYCDSHVYASSDLEMELAFTSRPTTVDERECSRPNSVILLLGDTSEWHASHEETCMANAALIQFDLKQKKINILSSIVGLPAVFIYQSSDMVIITSDIYLLTMIPGLRLYFDNVGIKETCFIGHPIDCRTLYKNVSMAPAGSSIAINKNGEIRTQKKWSLPEAKSVANWDVFTDLQIDAFKQAMKALNLSHSFLSLTAGLDTRTILASIVDDKHFIPTYTMSGKRLSLDARASRNLCAAYGIAQTLVEIDEEFRRNLPDYLVEASRLSGGLAACDQAHEVHFYKKVSKQFTSRLSGNLGNQVGRRGTEKISMRNADWSILNEDIINATTEESINHWYRDVKSENGKIDFQFLIQNEVPFSSVANYCIGNHYLIQQSPYANRKLIEITQMVPKMTDEARATSLLQMRLKDLHHRFLGESAARSFQVKLIRNVGGFVASYPINWGWRAQGGVSPTGIFAGGLSFVDALFASKAPRSKVISDILTTLKITGLHEYVQIKSTLDSMRDYVYDTLSDAVSNTALFNKNRVNQILHEHYKLNKYQYATLLCALDLACAQKVFNAGLSK